MDKLLIVSTTFNDRNEAEKVIQKLLKKRLAACAHLSSSIQSFYWWKGEIVNDQEYVASFKVVKSQFKKFEKYLKVHHSYDVPEIIAVEVSKVEADYLFWVRKETETKES